MASESGCPIEMHRIDIEKCDDMYDKECKGNRYMPFHRAGYDHKTGQSPNRPREQVKIASRLDIIIIITPLFVRRIVVPVSIMLECSCQRFQILKSWNLNVSSCVTKRKHVILVCAVR